MRCWWRGCLQATNSTSKEKVAVVSSVPYVTRGRSCSRYTGSYINLRRRKGARGSGASVVYGVQRAQANQCPAKTRNRDLIIGCNKVRCRAESPSRGFPTKKLQRPNLPVAASTSSKIPFSKDFITSQHQVGSHCHRRCRNSRHLFVSRIEKTRSPFSVFFHCTSSPLIRDGCYSSSILHWLDQARCRSSGCKGQRASEALWLQPLRQIRTLRFILSSAPSLTTLSRPSLVLSAAPSPTVASHLSMCKLPAP